MTFDVKNKIVGFLVSLERLHSHHAGVSTNTKVSRNSEQAANWRQRMFTTLSVGNGAGLAATWTYTVNVNPTASERLIALAALDTFGIGALLAGLTPLLLWWAAGHPIKAIQEYEPLFPKSEQRPNFDSALWHALRAVSYFIQQHLPHMFAIFATATFLMGIYRLRELIALP